MDIRELLEKADKKLFKVRAVDPDCSPGNIIPKKKGTMYQLRNRLIFRYNLWSFYYLYTVCLMYFYRSIICIEYVLCIFRLSTYLHPNVVKNANFGRLRRIWEFLPTLRGIMNQPPRQPRFLAGLPRWQWINKLLICNLFPRRSC